MVTINKEVCPTCGHTTNDRVVTAYSGMVRALVRIFYWCKQNNRHEFDRKEIKHLFQGVDNEIARWGDWVLFGNGMVYKPGGKGSWGLNMDRVASFIRGELKIPTSVAVRPDKTFYILEERSIREIKSISTFLDENLHFVAKYI